MKNETIIYVPNGRENLAIDEKLYNIATAKRPESTVHKDKSVSGKQCHICIRPTQHYIHSTSRYFTKHTGRPKYIYSNKPYVVCAECHDILRKIKNGMYNDYVPTNTDITIYKRELQQIRNTGNLIKAMAKLRGTHDL